MSTYVFVIVWVFVCCTVRMQWFNNDMYTARKESAVIWPF